MAPAGDTPSDADRVQVRALLGREPAGEYVVSVRGSDGGVVVIGNAPLMTDGTPMPTMYWLVDRRLVAEVSRIEADGAVDVIEAEIGLDRMDAVHECHRLERDALLPPGHLGPAPVGGVGGTRRGLKCLHAHLAWWLAGGDDPAGARVAELLADRGIDVPGRMR
jgi:hypothetical protein